MSHTSWRTGVHIIVWAKLLVQCALVMKVPQNLETAVLFWQIFKKLLYSVRMVFSIAVLPLQLGSYYIVSSSNLHVSEQSLRWWLGCD